MLYPIQLVQREIMKKKELIIILLIKINLKKNYKKKLDDKYKKICIVDIQGLENIIDYYGRENLLIIYLDASDKARKKRAKNRPNFSIYEWKRRLLDDNEQFNKEIIHQYTNCIINTEKYSLEEIIEQINDTYIYTLIANLSKILNTDKNRKINGNNNDK